MTTTPEERAMAASPASLAHKALGPFIGGNRKMLFVVGDARDVHAAIAQAIREAEDAALEDAAAAASGSALRALDAGYDRETTAIAIVTAIRALKSKD